LKLLTVILMLLTFGIVTAQEQLTPVMPVEDTVRTDADQEFMYRHLQSGILPSEEFMQSLVLPEFNLNYELAKRQDFKFFDRSLAATNILIPSNMIFSAHPLMVDTDILNGAAYRFGDNVTIGGYSYGGRSVFTAPFPLQNINNFDFRGSSLFMQYNISKNFRIETHINVTRSPGF
jgi:hypothetical protein